jgi:hypothetical protein
MKLRYTEYSPNNASPDCLAVNMRFRNAPPFIRREKAVLHFCYYVAHYKHARSFMKVNKPFKILSITVYAEKSLFCS